MTEAGSDRDDAVRAHGEPTPRAGRAALTAAIIGLGAAAVVLVRVPSEVFDLERFLLPKELALHLTALLLLVLRPPARRRLDLVDRLVLAFLGWSLLSTVFATNHWLALRGFGVHFSAAVVFFAARRLSAERRPWPLLGWLAAVAGGAAAIGAAQAYGLEWSWLADARPPGATFGNRNFLAHLLAIAAPIALVGAVAGRRRWLPGSLLVLALAVGTIVLTRSRAAWLALAAGGLVALVTLLVARHPLRGRLLAALMVAGAAIAAAILVPNELRWASDSPYAETLTRIAAYREGSGRGRLIQYQHSLKLVADRPVLGVGPGNWFVHYPRVTEPGDPAFAGHDRIPTNPWPSSDWVALITERGSAGALLLLLAGAAAVFAALGRAGRRGTTLPAMAAGSLAAALVAGLFDAVLLLAAPALFTAAIAGLCLPRRPPPADADVDASAAATATDAVQHEERPPTAPPPEPSQEPTPGWLRPASVVMAVALVALTGAYTAAIAVSTDQARTTLTTAARIAPFEHRLRLLLAESGPCSQREPHIRAALRLMPHHAGPAAAARACGVEVEE